MVQNMGHRPSEAGELGLERFNIRSQKGFETSRATKVGMTQVKPAKSTTKLGYFPSNVSITEHHSWVSGKVGVMPNVVDGSADQNQVLRVCRGGTREIGEPHLAKSDLANH